MPLTFYSRKGWCWLCVRCELETGIDCRILTQSSSREHSSTSFSFWLGCSTVGRWGPKPSVCSWFSLRGHPISVCGTWLNNFLTSTCFLWAYASAPNSTRSRWYIPISSTGCTCLAIVLLIYTGASLDWQLGRGSICYKSVDGCPCLR